MTRKRSEAQVPVDPQRWVAAGLALLLATLVVVTPVTAALAPNMLYKETALQWLAFGGVALGLLIFRHAPLALPRHALTWLLGALFLLGLASAAWALVPGYAIAQWMRWLLAASVLLAAFQLRGQPTRLIVLRAFFAAGTAVAVMGTLQYLFQLDVVPQANAPAATFSNRNVAMHVVVLCWMFGPFLMLLDTGRARCWVYALGTALMIAFSTYTQTRAAWLAMGSQALLLGLILMAARFQQQPLRVPGWRGPVVGAVLLLGVLVNLGPEGLDPVFTRVEDRVGSIADVLRESEEGSGAARIVIWQSTIELTRAHAPLGTGLGNFLIAHPPVAVGETVNVTYAHNDLLQLTAELGVVGGLLGLAIFALLMWRGLALLLAGAAGNLEGLALLIALGGVIANSQFSFPLQLASGLMLAGMLMGLWLRTEAEQDEARMRIVAPTWWLRGVVAAVLIGAGVLVTQWWTGFQRYADAVDAPVGAAIEMQTWVEHPVHLRVAKVAAQAWQSRDPRRAEQIARGYYALRDDNVIINNTLAVALIQQRRFLEADRIIEQTRPLEPRGYLRSWQNEQMLAAASGDLSRLGGVLDAMDAMPREMLRAQPGTLRDMAISAHRLGRSDRAVLLLQEGLQAYPHREPLHDALLSVLRMSGRHAEARAHLDQLDAWPIEAEAAQRLRERHRG